MSNKDSTKMWLWTQMLTNGKHIPSWNDDLLCSHEVNESGQYLKILTFPSWFAFEINEVPKLMISVCEVIPLYWLCMMICFWLQLVIWWVFNFVYSLRMPIYSRNMYVSGRWNELYKTWVASLTRILKSRT